MNHYFILKDGLKNIGYYCFLMVFIFFLCSCSHPPNKKANGYIEGRYTYIATSVSGILKALPVERGAMVKKGQTLFSLELQPESSDLQLAQKNVQQAIFGRAIIIARLAYAKATRDRYQFLVGRKAAELSLLDQERSNHEALLAQLSQSDANIEAQTASLERAKWLEAQKNGVAPVDGFVFDTYYRIGEYTSAQQPILSLLAPENIKAIFYVGEKDLATMKLGQKVLINCDYCKKAYAARVSYISSSAEYTPPVIYSEQTNASLVYRIEAEFSPQDAYNLHPGQPVTISYDTP